MNRRGFLRGLVGGVAVAAAAPSFPFRVFSFPTEIVVPEFHYSAVFYGRALQEVYQDAIRKQINNLDIFRHYRNEFAPAGTRLVTTHSSVPNQIT